MKAISLITRRDGLSREEFRRYYEETHCWLAMRHFPFQRYTRNHLIESTAGLDFDCLSEFTMAPDFDASGVMRSASRDMVLDDERQFMQPERIQVAAVQESILYATGEQQGIFPSARFALLFQRAGLGSAEFRSRVDVYAKVLARDIPGVARLSVDVLSPAGGSAFPFDAVLWLQAASASQLGTLSPGQMPGLLASIKVMTHSTPELDLQQRHVAFLP